MRWFRLIVTSILAGALIAGPAMAVDQKDGTALVPGQGYKVTVMGGTDGAVARPLAVDQAGVGSVQDAYRDAFQADVVTECNSLPLNTGFKLLGNGFSAFPFGRLAVQINRVATGGAAVDAARLYLMSSDDNVNFYPVVAPFVSTGAQVDTTKLDTVTVVLPSSPASFTFIVQFTETALRYAGRYICLGGIRDSTFSTTATNQKVSLVWHRRQN